eukprot:scaffold1782_cov414-Prasinococcus_capsulatus_cf.AAC.3
MKQLTSTVVTHVGCVPAHHCRMPRTCRKRSTSSSVTVSGSWYASFSTFLTGRALASEEKKSWPAPPSRRKV